MRKFLKNPLLLQESSRDFDFFSFDDNAKNLYRTLSANSRPTVTTIIAPYGSGKSVLLNEVKKISEADNKGKDTKWIFFECWQYPDKRDLWEGLIVESIERIEGEAKKNEIINTYSDLPSWRGDLANFLNSTKSAIGTVIAIFAISFVVLRLDNDWLTDTLVALLTALVVLLIATIGFFIQPVSKSSISRLSDYKQELTDSVTGYEGTLYIVLEDVDRAGALGMRFFETVSHFIKDSSLKDKNIKIIVPISDDSKHQNLIDSIEKVSDNTLRFNPRYNADKYLSELFTDEFLTESTTTLLSSTINPLISGSISIRKMKHVLRNAIIKHERLNDGEFKSKLEICIAIEFSKYMRDNFGTSTLFNNAANQFKHIPLYNWAQVNQLLSTTPDDPETEVEAVDYFKSSSEIFDDIRHEDHHTNMTRSKPIVRREYLISRAYFDDI